MIVCPDGSCEISSSRCPWPNGCSILDGKTYRCANGECIDPLT